MSKKIDARNPRNPKGLLLAWSSQPEHRPPSCEMSCCPDVRRLRGNTIRVEMLGRLARTLARSLGQTSVTSPATVSARVTTEGTHESTAREAVYRAGLQAMDSPFIVHMRALEAASPLAVSVIEQVLKLRGNTIRLEMLLRLARALAEPLEQR